MNKKNQWLQEWENWKDNLWGKQAKGKLKVESKKESLGNDLYRVEIHKVRKQTYDGTEAGDTTFKWARNNGAIAARVVQISDSGEIVTIQSNPQAQFYKENWIEINSEERELAGLPGYFAKIEHVKNNELTLGEESELEKIKELEQENPIITARLWGDEAKEIASNEDITLEKDIKIKFDDDDSNKYRTGDYWLIPTRSQEAVVWDGDGEEPHGIDYYYCPLAIAKYSSSKGNWEEEITDCRKVFPALTEVFRETAVMNGTIKGTSLSLGVHGYNDSRRASDLEKVKHTEDKLDIQGGKHLKLNVGYWQDELGGTLPDVPDAEIGFWVNDQKKMYLTKDLLTITEGVSVNPSLTVTGNLTVTGTSHLQGVVSIGGGDPDEAIGLKVKQDLSVIAGSAGEVVGLKLEPKLTANNNNDKLTGLRIVPDFHVIGDKKGVKEYGLIVEGGKVGIGANRSEDEESDRLNIGMDLHQTLSVKDDLDWVVGLYINPDFTNTVFYPPRRYGLMVAKGQVGVGSLKSLGEVDDLGMRVGVNLQPEVSGKNEPDKLVGLYINPKYTNDVNIGEKDKYGLIVEGGRVAFGPKVTPVPGGDEEYLVDIGRDGAVSRLKVAGDLEVYGKVTYHAKKEKAGKIELGQQNEDKLQIHGKLETQHTSGKLKVTSPLEIELEGGNTQDFLSLFSANDSENVNGRIVWKKGTVTEPGDAYNEDAQVVAAIYSSLKADGVAGDLRFGTTSAGTVTDRMVITADGKVGIGTTTPGTNQLQVTGTTDLATLIVENGLQVKGKDGTKYTKMLKLHLEGVQTENQDEREENPTLKVKNGGVCIGAESIPKDDEKRDVDVEEIKLYVDGKVTFAQDLSVFGKAKVNTLNVKPKLKATKKDDVLTAVEIDPSFDIKKTDSLEFQNVKQWGLKVVSGDVKIASGNVAIGSDDPAGHKLKVASGTTLLDGDLQVGESNIALKVNQKKQEVGIGGVSESNYKLAVAGATKIAGKLEVVPSLSGASNAVEIKPTFTKSGNQTAVLIDPTFPKDKTKNFGLHVVKENVALCSTSGGVAIGSSDPAGKRLKVTGETLLENKLTVSNGGVAVSAGGVAVSAGGTTTDALTVTGDTTLGNATLSGTLGVTGDSTLSSNLAVSGNVAIGSTTVDASHKLKVTGGTTTDTLTVTGASTLSSLTASGNVAIGDKNAGNEHSRMQSGLNCPLYVYKYDVQDSNLVEMARFERGCDDASNVAEAEGGYIGLWLNDCGTQKNNKKSRIEAARISWRFDNKDQGGGKNDEVSGRLGFWTSHDKASNPDSPQHDLVERLTIRKDGKVGIGTKDPDVKLQVMGDIKSNDNKLTSDGTLKENIQTLKDGLSKILGLRGVTYQRKDNKEVPQEATEIGLVAQEVEEFFPELVSTDSEGTKSLSYSRLIAPLIEAVKDQQGQILGLVQQIQQQQTQIEQLQALNNG
ncbi:MAG: tail fiber domain-containing protein [Hormoscilla sp. GM7CHS1pb]|nr:tail fiber domain-containing protein [Hormoscilla sp. GM7CHS1pb]